MEQQKQELTFTQGFSILGTARKYGFQPLPAILGLKLFHLYLSLIIEYLPRILAHLPQFQEFVRKISQENRDGKIEVNADLIAIIRLIPELFTWERTEELSRVLLAGCIVEIGNERHVCDESGMCKAFSGNPVECYLAIVSAIVHNWSPFFSSLKTALDSDDSTPDSGQ